MFIIIHHLKCTYQFLYPSSNTKQFGKGMWSKEDLKNMNYKTQWEFWPEIVNTYNMFTQLGVENFDGVFAMILNNVFKYTREVNERSFLQTNLYASLTLSSKTPNTQFKVPISSPFLVILIRSFSLFYLLLTL